MVINKFQSLILYLLGCIVFVVSSEGGTNIEEVAAVSPEKITTTSIDLVTGVEARHGMHNGSSLGLDAT